MQNNDAIEPSSSPWATPIVLVRKKDGSTRSCVDYRRLNDVTKKNSYTLPRIDDTLDTLAGNTWFSTLDLKSGY
ncbi:retrovirus-related Pol polyprotein from transposon 412 [Trichonephila clavipes]|uniref:Retrovirus-related Pol polyprotein from transposon 412 n=1 Tax=Trichonephila clavipes TaxID=2585209 RepID=A0A8X6RXF0_TRICX|nr:retrovirus-related Pol polyprotein from transposon 412 [Trichonephila clavipes]